MSKLDFTQQEKLPLEAHEVYKNFVSKSDLPSNKKLKNKSDNMDIDLQDWLEIFEEDQVQMQGCGR